jgi:hypothetical protein
MTCSLDKKEIRHPSFGMMSIAKGVCSESMNLFGSSIKQRSFIQIQIHQAVLIRDLSRDWVLQEGLPIVSLYLSPSQFADAITSLNTKGTPCTINFMNGKSVLQSSLENKRVQFDTEFEKQMKKVSSDANRYYTKINEILSKPSIGKHDREEILKQIGFLKQEIASNIPFIKKQFTEQMDKTVVEAKNEVTSFLEEKLKRLGLEGFKKELQASLEYVEDEKET